MRAVMKGLIQKALGLSVLLLVSTALAGPPTPAAAPAKTPAPAPAPAPAPTTESTLRIAAAADLKFALEELLKDFRARHPGAQVEAVYGSSGSFVAQLSEGAPFDMFLSADMGYPGKIVEKGLAEAGAVFPYAVGHVVVWVPKASALPVEKLGMKVLLDPTVKHISLANPQHAPYGRAAEAALKSQGLYDAVKDKLVLGENVAQAAQFAQSGAAEVGLIAKSLALSPAMKDQGRFFEVPESAHPRMDQGGIILKKARDPELARQLRDALLGAQGRTLLERYGLTPPAPAP